MENNDEKKILEFWEKKKIYKFDAKKKGKIYSIDTPPPTVSGDMHVGHAFSYSQQDFIARFWRMQLAGKGQVFYPFGTDDNGLPTERLVERLNNVKSRDMSRWTPRDFSDRFSYGNLLLMTRFLQDGSRKRKSPRPFWVK